MEKFGIDAKVLNLTYKQTTSGLKTYMFMLLKSAYAKRRELIAEIRQHTRDKKALALLDNIDPERIDA
jgi:hypothetical protein